VRHLPFKLGIAFIHLNVLILGAQISFGEMIRQEIWPGVSLLLPTGSVVSYDAKNKTYDVELPSGSAVFVDKWRLPRWMRSYSNKRVAQMFRTGERDRTIRFSMRPRGRTITHRRLDRVGWLYEQMFRANRSEFVQAKTYFGRNHWNLPRVAEARAVVDSLMVR